MNNKFHFGSSISFCELVTGVTAVDEATWLSVFHKRLKGLSQVQLQLKECKGALPSTLTRQRKGSSVKRG